MSDISIIVRKMRLVAESNLAEFDIGFPEQLVIMYLSAHGICNQTAIADELEIDKGSIAKTVGKLEVKGLVKRSENPLNRRENLVELTQAADEILVTMRAAHRQLDEMMFAGLDDGQIEAMNQALAHIAGNLSKTTKEERS